MGLIELVKACGALNIARTLIEGATSRAAGFATVYGKAAINETFAKLAGARKYGVNKSYAVRLDGGGVEWFTSGYLSLPEAAGA